MSVWRSLISLWKEDDLLDRAWQRSHQMLDIDHQMFRAAVDMLRRQEGTASGGAAEVHSKDRLVDAYEQEVRRMVLTHCAVAGPGEVPGSLTLVSIVGHIERIGDYVRHIADLAATFPRKLEAGSYEDDLQRVERAVEENFTRTRECVESCRDEDAARLLEEYAWVKGTCYDRIMDLVRDTESSMPGYQMTALALYFRWLKRISAHLLNLTRSMIKPFDQITASRPVPHLDSDTA